MITPIVKGANATETADEIHSSSGHEPKDVNSATSNSSSPVRSEEVGRQIKAATDPLTRQLQRLCDLMKELKRAHLERNEETTGVIQGPAWPHSSRFGILFFGVVTPTSANDK